MIDPRHESRAAADTEREHIAVRSHSETPRTAHVVGDPTHVPRVGWSPLIWWGLVIPGLVAIALLLGFWFLPALHSNSENREHIGVMRDNQTMQQQ